MVELRYSRAKFGVKDGLGKASLGLHRGMMGTGFS